MTTKTRYLLMHRSKYSKGKVHPPSTPPYHCPPRRVTAHLAVSLLSQCSNFVSISDVALSEYSPTDHPAHLPLAVKRDAAALGEARTASLRASWLAPAY